MTNINDAWETNTLPDQDNVLIIDTMNYIYRGVVGPLTGPYVLIYNFFKNLRATIELFKPTKIFFALEGHPKDRYALLPEYKANRIVKTGEVQSKKDQIKEAANEITRLLGFLPVIQVKHPDYEADDIIAFLAENLKDEECTIISGDSDLIQLLQKGYTKLKLYNYHIKDETKRYIQPPSYPYHLHKCLTGDKSDNIPRLLSAKKADAMINDLEKLKEFLQIEENRANFNLNLQLIELKTISPDGIVFIQPSIDYDFIKSEFERMDCKSLITDTYWEKFVNTFKNLE